MTRFNSKAGAGVLVGLGLICMVFTLLTGHRTSANEPDEVAVLNNNTGVNVWQAAAMITDASTPATVIDIRSGKSHGEYFIPGSLNITGLSARELVDRSSKGTVVVVSSNGKAAEALVATAKNIDPGCPVRFLKNGVRSWYLAFEMPVPLFADAPPPIGYTDAISTVKQELKGRVGSEPRKVSEALSLLSRLNYQPSAVKNTGSPSKSKRRKISGGCG